MPVCVMDGGPIPCMLPMEVGGPPMGPGRSPATVDAWSDSLPLPLLPDPVLVPIDLPILS